MITIDEIKNPKCTHPTEDVVLCDSCAYERQKVLPLLIRALELACDAMNITEDFHQPTTPNDWLEEAQKELEK